MTSDRRNPNQMDRRSTVPRRGGRRAQDLPAEWVSATIYAQRYGIDRKTVRKWLRAQILRTYQVGTLLRIRNLPPNEHHVRTDAETGTHPLPNPPVAPHTNS